MSYQTDFRTALFNRLTYWGDFSATQANMLADMGLAQSQVEGADFTSSAFKASGNCIGYGYNANSIWQNGQKLGTTDDVGTLGGYNTVQDCAGELADWIHRRAADFVSVATVQDYANAMSADGYMTESPVDYANNMNYYYQATAILGVYVKNTWIFIIGGVTIAAAVIAFIILKRKH